MPEPRGPDNLHGLRGDGYGRIDHPVERAVRLAQARGAVVADGIGSDADGRAWHDRLGRTVVTRSVPRAS